MKTIEVNFGRNNTRIQTYFKKMNLHTVQDILDYPVGDLAIKNKGFGQISLTSVIETFIKLGFLRREGYWFARRENEKI